MNTKIEILRYSLSPRYDVQAYVNLLIDGWVRINGLRYMRNQTIATGQLTPMKNGKILFVPAIEIPDPERRAAIEGVICAAILAHLETLPPEQRIIPPVPPKPKKPKAPPPAAPQAKQVKRTEAVSTLSIPAPPRPAAPAISGKPIGKPIVPPLRPNVPKQARA